MDKPELNKKSLKELRGELLTKRNRPYWQNDETVQKPTDTMRKSSEMDSEEFDEEDMGMGM